MIRPAETYWRAPHGAEWVNGYAASTFGEHRGVFGRAVKAVAPFATALDMGCNCGVILPWLVAAAPDAVVTGVDLSAEALASARRCWPQHEWIHDSLVDWLPRQLGVRQWEVAVSSSCLAHVAPPDIAGTLDAVALTATRALVLQEVCAIDGIREGTSKSGVLEWRYDYVARLGALGWTCTTHWRVDDGRDRPAAVMVFTR